MAAALVVTTHLVIAGPASAASTPQFGGTWNLVDTCTSSNCAGEHFSGTLHINQCPGSASFSGDLSGVNAIAGTQSGGSVMFSDSGGGYVAEFQVALSSDGQSFTGSYTDNGHGTGTTQGTRTASTSRCSCSASQAAAARGAAATIAGCKQAVVLSGTVFHHECSSIPTAAPRLHCRQQTPAPLAGEKVIAIGDRKTYETKSSSKGTWSLRVPKGPYAVKLLTFDDVDPRLRNIDARGNVGGLDFTVCTPPKVYNGPHFDCKTVEIDGQVFGSDGFPYRSLGVAIREGNNVIERPDTTTDTKGEFVLYTQPGTIKLDLLEGDNSQDQEETVHATHDTTVRYTLQTKIHAEPSGSKPNATNRVDYLIVGLATTQDNFTVELQRNPPLDSLLCSDGESEEITRGQDSGRDAIGAFRATGLVADHFCPGEYTITVNGPTFTTETFRIR